MLPYTHQAIHRHRSLRAGDNDDVKEGFKEKGRLRLSSSLRVSLVAAQCVSPAFLRPVTIEPLDKAHYPCLSDDAALLKKCQKGSSRSLLTKRSALKRPAKVRRRVERRNAIFRSRSGEESSTSAPPPSLPRQSSLKKAGSARRFPSHSVSFSTIEIRSYETILGDNPSCRSGPPLELSWRYDPSRTQLLSVFEYDSRLETSGARVSSIRCTEELVLSAETRNVMLVKAGYTPKELAWAAKKLQMMRRRHSPIGYRHAQCDLLIEKVPTRRRGVMHKGLCALDKVDELTEECYRIIREHVKVIGRDEKRRLQRDIEKGWAYAQQRASTATVPTQNKTASKHLCLNSG